MGKVLVIDDDPNNRLLLLTLLKYAGHSALEAETGSTGAQIAAAETPDLIIVDLSLPDISGPELLRTLRADPRTKGATIALYTATRLAPAIEELVEIYGVRGVIPKPGDPQEILRVIESLVNAPSA
jgi:CheY-like chemotaxis protein